MQKLLFHGDMTNPSKDYHLALGRVSVENGKEKHEKITPT